MCRVAMDMITARGDKDADQAFALHVVPEIDVLFRVAHAASAESIVMEGAFDAVVETAFNDLPDRFKRVVELVDIDQLSYQEAADIIGIPVGTVMSRLYRARRRIREQLTKTGLAPRTPS
jgi:RNA polymerase sigma-70 factor (ECF subfamily)